MKKPKTPKRFCLQCGHEVTGARGFNDSSNHNRGCPYKTLMKPAKEEPKHKKKKGLGKIIYIEEDFEID